MRTRVGQKSIRVELTLAETEVLCQLLVRSVMEQGVDPTRPVLPQLRGRPTTSTQLLSAEAVASHLERQRVLIRKLARASDLLAGRAVPWRERQSRRPSA